MSGGEGGGKEGRGWWKRLKKLLNENQKVC